MAYINGGLVLPITHRDIYDLVPNKSHHKYLTQHRTPKFIHLADRLISVNPDLQEMLGFIRDNVSKSWIKRIKGYIIGYALRMYMFYNLNPQWYAYRMDLLFYASYVFIQKYLQRLASVMINEYGYTNKFYNFYIPKDKLYSLSKLYADSMYETSLDMVKHLKKLQSKD